MFGWVVKARLDAVFFKEMILMQFDLLSSITKKKV